MNLLALRTRIRSFVREPRENFVSDAELIDWLNDASFEATKLINYPWKEQILYGVADQADYSIPSDFYTVHPLLDVMFGKKKLDSYSVQWLEKEYPDYPLATGVEYPERYYMRYVDKISLYPPPSLIDYGTATSNTGTSTLIDSAASFPSSYVGHAIHNTVDGSYGLITSVVSETELVAALSGGVNDFWSLNDTYTINRSGTVPYVYKEALMSADTDESLVAARFPYLVIYGAIPIAELKTYRAESSSKEILRAQRWEQLYLAELAKAKSTIHRFIRGKHSRTISPDEW